MQTKHYRIISKTERRKLSSFLCKDGQFLLPIVDLMSQAEMAVDELIDVVGRVAVEPSTDFGTSSAERNEASGCTLWYYQNPGMQEHCL